MLASGNGDVNQPGDPAWLFVEFSVEPARLASIDREKDALLAILDLRCTHFSILRRAASFAGLCACNI